MLLLKTQPLLFIQLQDFKVKRGLWNLIQLSHLKMSKQWSGPRSHQLWSLLTYIDIWPSHISHLNFILINYLTSSPNSPNILWTHSNSITKLLTLPNSSSHPKTCSSLVNTLSSTRYHPWFWCHPDAVPLSSCYPQLISWSVAFS